MTRKCVLLMALALLLHGPVSGAEARKLSFRPKLERHKGTGQVVLLLTLANEEEKARSEEVRVQSVELKIKDAVFEPDTELPLVIGEVEAMKEETVSLRFDRRVGKKGDVGRLTIRGVDGKNPVLGTFRVTIP